LAGWILSIRSLTDWNDDGISMFPNTAACLVGGGAALLALGFAPKSRVSVGIARAVAIGIALVGGLTLIEHLTDINLGIDTLISDQPWGQRASTSLMRMGPPASVSFLLLGAAIWLITLGSESRRFGGELALLVLGIASLSLVGYWFGADQLFGIARITGIAAQTSLSLAALSMGLMMLAPDHGIVAALGRDDAGGTVLRRLIVPVIVIPLIVGWVRLTGQQAGYFDLPFGTAIRTVTEIILLLGLLWWTATGISELSREAREAQAAARRADRRKDEFLATLAHEMRNPLAPIGNALQLIQHADGDPVLQQQARQTMQRQFSQMVRLVDDLLDVSRITRDRLDLRKERVELQSVINHAVETCRPAVDAAGHSLSVQLPATAIWLDADPVRLGQVFSNLINNACKFTPERGQIVVAAERDDGSAVITVRDSGIGIAAENLEGIFEIFEQVDRTLERTRSGLGIGLTLVKQLVELHGGSVTARSDGVGHGSEFVVRLPVLPGAAATPGAPDVSRGAKPPSRRVLVTDDNRDAANSLAMLLKLGGHQVATAYDGIEAVEKAASYRPDVMLLDLGMPGKNGYDVCRSIRQEPWGKDIRIVALTGWGQEQDRQKTREAGFDEHLVKPVSATALNEVLAAAT
jgi:signal transduction histidine kinase/CheY-like chemotaxis protein